MFPFLRRVWCQIPWRQLSLEGFVLKRALGCELGKDKHGPLAGKREAKETRRVFNTLQRDERMWVS